MRKTKKIVFSFLTFVASYFFLFWTLGGIIYIPFESQPPKWILLFSQVASFAIASYLAFTVWKNTGEGEDRPSSLSSFIFSGALALGVLGFLFGFFGPLIFTPESNQGPLLGIFITGPGGVILGAIGGAILWVIKRKGIKTGARK